MAPSAKVSRGLGTTMVGSKNIMLPRPLHSGQAPWGLLKLNRRGEISAKLMPQWMQANFSLNRISEAGFPDSPRTSTLAIPSPNFKAVSIDSAKRDWIFFLMTSRST